MKRTKDEDRQITLTAFARGGASVLTPENYPLLEGVAGYMEMGGIEKMDYDSYCEMLAQEEMAFSVTFTFFILRQNVYHGILRKTTCVGKGR